jgi:ABC-type transport system involved in multi-copper enzyme maturation permease subunit
MRMLRFFIAHEWLTQVRSIRFRGLAIAYVLACIATPVVVFAAGRRSTVLLGPGAYNAIVLMAQPLLTSLLAAGLSVDAISRERDDGSWGVLSVAPISSAGYLARRWFAVVAICIAISLVPTLVTAALAIRTAAALPLVTMFAEGWLMNVLPALLASSAIAIALGTITGRTVLAIVFAFLVLIVGLEMINGVLFYAHVRFDGPSELFGGSLFGFSRIQWLIKGYVRDFPSDAAYPLRTHARAMLVQAGTGAAFAVLLLGIATFYLKRTRRDLRPWKIPEKHQLRTMLKTANRVREEFTPDSGVGFAERAALTGALLIVAMIFGYLVRRKTQFEQLAAARYAAESASSTEATSVAIVADSADIAADLGSAGDVRSRAVLAIRNHGADPISRLSFNTNPLMAVRRADVSRGSLSMRRMWQRLDVTIDPPLAAGESRHFTFELEGTPGDVEFNLQSPGRFGQRWMRYVKATQAIYLTDLSRSTIEPYATEVRAALYARDLAPVVRYAPWQVTRDQRQEGFISETWIAPTALHVRFAHHYPVAADSCGAIARATLESRCTVDLPQYLIFGGPFGQVPIATSASLTYIPAHVQMARIHAPALAAAVRLAAESWPSLALPPRITFAELPHEAGENEWYIENYPTYTVRQIAGNGALLLVPETIFTRTKPMNSSIFAAAILSGTMRSRRRVVATEAPLFERLFTLIAAGRVGLRKLSAVEPGSGPPPETGPILLAYDDERRVMRVLAAIEYRVGAAAFVEGIDDFVNARAGAGSAKELLLDIGRRGGVDLSRMYEDNFVHGGIPKLTLVDVHYRRSGKGWLIDGAVKNDGTGEAFVPLALRTSQGTQWQTLRVDTAQRVAFSFSTDADPRSVQLDPDQVCYRHAAIGTVEVEEFRGAS